MVVSCIDFFENYTMKIQNDIQNMHWHNFQISILVHITYHRNPEYDILDSCSLPFLKEVHYYVSNDKHHDSLFVQHAFMLHWEFLQTIGCFPSQHMVWRDGCSRQFKSVRVWYFVSCYPSLTTCFVLPIGY